jgi:hypothetical protein
VAGDDTPYNFDSRRSSPRTPMPDSNCPHLSKCEMYALLRLAGTLKTWQARYCCADYSACVRFQRSAKGAPVPQNLMPNGALLKVTR